MEKKEKKQVLSDLISKMNVLKEYEGLSEQKKEVAAQIGVNPEDIEAKLDIAATKLGQEGIIVELHIGRTRFEQILKPSDIGISTDNEDMRNFITDYINLGRRRLIPASYIKKLNAIESRARRCLENNSFETGWGRFVPYKLFPKFHEKIKEIEEKYKNIYSEIILNYDKIREQCREVYKSAAPEIYKMLEKNRDVVVPKEFVTEFTESVMNYFPRRESIENAYMFEMKISFVPLSSTMKEMQQQIYERKELMETQKEIAKQIKEGYKKEVEGFISDISVQLRSMVYEAVSKARESFQKNGSLTGPSVKSLKEMVLKVKALNFMGDEQIIYYTQELEQMLEKDADERNSGEISMLLSHIAEENRRVLSSLGHEPRAKRKKVEVKFDKIDIKYRRRRKEENEKKEKYVQQTLFPEIGRKKRNIC